MDAFLLLKPDCLEQGRSGWVERAVAAEGLRIDDRHGIVLAPPDVRALWAEYDERGHALTLGFLDRYLTTGRSEVWLVSGPDAFEAARRVKRAVRSRFAEGPFANLIHAAEHRDELDRQLGHLTGGTTTEPGADRQRPHLTGCATEGPGATRQRPPGNVTFDVPALVGEVWPLIQGEPTDPGPVVLGDGDQAVFLGPDRAHTLDSTVTALWHALPGVSPRQAVLLTLRAGFTGGVPVAVGGRAAIRRCLRVLHEHGITNCDQSRWRRSASQATASG
ncbi:MAG TPA: hypothetical protein VN408_12655 [Actinoplanes sp.]|nr:hypothetical protein [Actinoplanes sp.]